MKKTKSHSWVTLVNPRNGKIRINACTRCGVLRMGSALTSECSKSNINSRSLEGWKEVSQMAL